MESWVMRLKHWGLSPGGIMDNEMEVEYGRESEALGQTFGFHLRHRQDSGKGSDQHLSECGDCRRQVPGLGMASRKHQVILESVIIPVP